MKNSMENLDEHLQQTEYICRDFINGINFVVHDASRDPKYNNTHLLTYLVFEYLQSAISILSLVNQGIHSVCKREIRFLLEMSIRICYIQQEHYGLDIDAKLEYFEDILNSSNISILNN